MLSLTSLFAGRTLWTFTIVTTDANKEFSWLHDRQPVFLSNTAAVNKWLDTSPQVWTADLTQMVKPYNDTSAPLDWYFFFAPFLAQWIDLAFAVIRSLKKSAK